MPLHDWTRVIAGTFHDFHGAWIYEMRRQLNRGLLPPGYYAQAEQVARPIVPDVLTLQRADRPVPPSASTTAWDADGGRGGLAVATAPPPASIQETLSEAMFLAARRRRLVIRHASGDRIVALIEIVSPGNKEKRGSVRQFVDTVVAAFDDGRHVSFIDVFPPGRFDGSGMHGAVWDRFGGTYEPPPDRPLVSAAYAAGNVVNCYVEPLAVGSTLPPMPLFLTLDRYVNIPLESTYADAYADVPERWKETLEA